MENHFENQSEKPRWRLAVPIVVGVLFAYYNWAFMMVVVDKSAVAYGVDSEIMTFRDRQILATDIAFGGSVYALATLLLIYPLSRWATPTTRKAVFLSFWLMLVFFAGIAWGVWSAFTVKP